MRYLAEAYRSLLVTFLTLLGLIEGTVHTNHVDGNQDILQLSGLPKGFPHPSPPRQELGFGITD